MDLKISEKLHLLTTLSRKPATKLTQRLEWPSSEEDVKMCRMKGKSAEQCQNYIRVLKLQSADMLYVCGTNSYKPRCRAYLITVSLATKTLRTPTQAAIVLSLEACFKLAEPIAAESARNTISRIDNRIEWRRFGHRYHTISHYRLASGLR